MWNAETWVHTIVKSLGKVRGPRPTVIKMWPKREWKVSTDPCGFKVVGQCTCFDIHVRVGDWWQLQLLPDKEMANEGSIDTAIRDRKHLRNSGNVSSDSYAVFRPSWCIRRMMAWRKWKLHPFVVASGNTSLLDSWYCCAFKISKEVTHVANGSERWIRSVAAELCANWKRVPHTLP